jgi:hypothetical protein
MLEIAAAYDVPLLVQFVDWEDWLRRMADVSPPALEKRPFNRERLMAKAKWLAPPSAQQHDPSSRGGSNSIGGEPYRTGMEAADRRSGQERVGRRLADANS